MIWYRGRTIRFRCNSWWCDGFDEQDDLRVLFDMIDHVYFQEMK